MYPRPMDFSLLRLAVVYLALLALWGLRPGAAAWHEAYLTHRAKYRPAVLVLGCMLCLLAAAAPFADARNSGVATSFYNVENWDGESRITFTQHISDWQNDSAAQYGALAHSLLNGRLDLQRDPPPPWRRCRTLTIPPPVRARPRMLCGMLLIIRGGTMFTLALCRACCSSCRLSC